MADEAVPGKFYGGLTSAHIPEHAYAMWFGKSFHLTPRKLRTAAWAFSRCQGSALVLELAHVQHLLEEVKPPKFFEVLPH